MAPSTPAPSRYRERLTVPVGWWLVALAVAFTLVVAVWAYMNAWFGAAMAVLCLVCIAVALVSYGKAVVAVDERGVQAGLARIEWPYVGAVEVIDEKQAKDVMVHADARSYLLTRPYVKQLVRIEVNDPADPHPAWLVSTRHPRRLAAVAEQVRG